VTSLIGNFYTTTLTGLSISAAMSRLSAQKRRIRRMLIKLSVTVEVEIPEGCEEIPDDVIDSMDKLLSGIEDLANKCTYVDSIYDTEWEEI
jgi:hypothetical protein